MTTTSTSTIEVTIPYVDEMLRTGYGGTAHLDNGVLWLTIEILQLHLADTQLIGQDSDEESIAQQRLMGATAKVMAALIEASIRNLAGEVDTCTDLLEIKAFLEMPGAAEGVEAVRMEKGADVVALDRLQRMLRWSAAAAWKRQQPSTEQPSTEQPSA